MNLLILAWEFFKTGLFSIGGGLATLPFLSRMGETYGWFTQEELANMLAISESTPGPIGVNMATYTGNTVGGVLGGCIATLALVLPSYIVILLVFRIIHRYKDNALVKSAMSGLRPASVGMIGAAVLGVLQSVLVNGQAQVWQEILDLPKLIMFVVLLGVYLKFNKLHPVVILVAGAVAGIAMQM